MLSSLSQAEIHDCLSPDEAGEFAAELTTLSRMQYEALQKASYLRMSEFQREAYDRRRLRIGELRALLMRLQADKLGAA